MKGNDRWGLALLGAAVSLFLGTAADAQEREAKMIAITTWDAGCSGSTRSSWDNMADAWYNEITGFWLLPQWSWTKSGRRVNGSIVESDFVDCGSHAWGNDCNRTDDADAVLVALHGGNASDNHRWFGVVRVDEAGTGDCLAWQGRMEFGDGDMEFLLLSSCYSMDREDWWSEWNSLHQIDGFHGLMWIYSWLPDYYEDFAFDAFFVGMADAWLDNLYIPDINNGYDQCPVARNVGVNSSDSLTRMNLERYSFVFNDPPGLNASSRNHRARYIVGCDPKGKEALP